MATNAAAPMILRISISPLDAKSAKNRSIPFGLGRQFLAGPFGIGFDVPVGDVNDGMLVESADVATRAVRTTPISAEIERPPFAPVPQVHGLLGRRENQRTGLEHMRQSIRIVFRIGRNFGKDAVARRVPEFAQLPFYYRRPSHPESVHSDAMDRRFLRIMPVPGSFLPGVLLERVVRRSRSEVTLHT